jgi:hypothetical protein
MKQENHKNAIHVDHEALMEQAMKIYHEQSQHETTTRVQIQTTMNEKQHDQASKREEA